MTKVSHALTHSAMEAYEGYNWRDVSLWNIRGRASGGNQLRSLYQEIALERSGNNESLMSMHNLCSSFDPVSFILTKTVSVRKQEVSIIPIYFVARK